MSTESTVSDPPVQTTTVTVAPQKTPIAFSNVGVNLSTFEDAYRFANVVVKSGLAPKGFTTPEAVLIAIQHGAEIGLPPMAALQGIAVINGRPGIFGDTALALVRGSGLCAFHGEAETDNTTDGLFRELQFALYEKNVELGKTLSKKFVIAQSAHKTEADDFGVTVATVRKDGSMEFERFTVADAKRAGLWGKDGPWRQYPKRMLKFRARGFKLRDAYGDVLKGLRTVEELQDIPAEVNVTPKASISALIGAPASEPPAAIEEASAQPPAETKAEAPAAPEEKRPRKPKDEPKPVAQVDTAKADADAIEKAVLDDGISEVRLWNYAKENGLVPEGATSLWKLPADALAKVAKALPGLKEVAK